MDQQVCTADNSRPRFTAALVYWPILLALLFLLLAPLHGFGFSAYPFNDQRSAQIVVIVLTQLALLYLVVAGRYVPSLPAAAFYCVLAFIALGALSGYLMAQQKAEAVGEVALWVGVGSIATLAAQWIKRDSDVALRWIVVAVLCLGGVYVLGVAVRLLATFHLDQEIDVWVFVLSGYTNPRFPSTTLALVTALMLVTARRDIRSLLFPLALASCIWAIQMGLGTRAAWAATALALVAIGVLLGFRRTIRIQLFTLASMGLGALTYFGFMAAGKLSRSGLGMVGRVGELSSTSSREMLWSKSIEYAVSAPLLGIGPMQFATETGNVMAHPHNWMLQVGAEWGLPALALLCAAGYLTWRDSKCRQDLAAGTHCRDAAMFAAMVAVLYGLLDGNHVMPVSQTAVALTIGIFLGISTEQRNLVGSTVRMLSLATILCVSLLFLVTFTLRTYPCQRASVEQVIQLEGFSHLAPRFWLNGWIPFCR